MSATSEAVVAAVRAWSYRYQDEAELQRHLAETLAAAGVRAEREVRLDARTERIDFLAGRVGIEIKVAGSAAQVARQLNRYAASGLVDELVLVTTRARHRSVAPTMNGKPVTVVVLGGL